MRRICLSVILLILLCTTLTAKHSDEYMIGTYSFLWNPFHFYTQYREPFLKYMQDMGYNSNIIQTSMNDRDLPGLLAALDKYGIDTWVLDRGFSKEESSMFRYAINPLTTSSYQRFEAEYASEQDLKPGDSRDNRFWYASRSEGDIIRIGRPVANTKASNGYAWQASRIKDKPGYIYTDIRYRWPRMNGEYLRFGNEFFHYQKNPPDFPGDYLWFKYRFKIDNPSNNIKPEDALLSLSICGYDLVSGQYAKELSTALIEAKGTKAKQINFSYADLMQYKDKDSFIELDVRVSYKDMLNANLMTANLHNNPKDSNSQTVMKLASLNPRIYWHGNADVELDYIEVRDQINYELNYERDKWATGILQRAKHIKDQPAGNVSGFYSFDEPHQGQFDSFKVVQDILKQEGIPMFTATYDYKHKNVVIDKDNKVYYDHQKSFQEVAKPLIFAPDIYPLTPDLNFNPRPDLKSDDNFIQTVFDTKLLRVYEDGKKYTLQDESRKLYPIVQSFGKWAKADKDNWVAWLLPPYATQKAMLYLPLCYGADGIIHYRLQAFLNAEGYGEYAGLNSTVLADGYNYSAPVEDKTTIDAIKHSNPKVYTYGKLIKHMQWLGASVVMESRAKTQAPPAQMLVKSMVVKAESGAPYSGYIQAGYYLDADKSPNMVVVNRRANYFKPGVYSSEKHVPPAQFNEYFPQAAPQKLVINLDKASVKKYGTTPALFDPADKQLYLAKNNTIELEIEAGEAKMLQMTGSVPAKPKGKHNLPSNAVIYDSVELQKGAKLVLSKNSKLSIMPGAKLIVPENSSIVMDGQIELLGDAAIIVNGKVKDRQAQIIASPKSTYQVQASPKRGFFKRLFGCK